MNKKYFIEKNLLLKYFFYPIASVVSKLLIHTKIKPINITMLWIFIIFLTLLLNKAMAGIYILMLFLLAYFLDCLDGQFARLSKQTSERGKLLDDFGGEIFLFLFWYNCGVIIDNELNFISTTKLSLFICLLIFLKNSFSLRSLILIRDIQYQTSKDEGSSSKFSINRIMKMPFSFGELMWPLVFACYYMNFLHLFMFIYAIYQIASFVLIFNNGIRNTESF